MGLTVRAAIDRVDAIKPNAFSDAQKLQWLKEIEGRIAADVLLIWHYETVKDMLPTSMTDELLLEGHYEDVYYYWLEAHIDEANGEYDKYANTMALFNSAYKNFVRWFAETYEPAQGYFRERRPFYA